MSSYLFEVKAMLRSILISSPVILTVSELDNDFKEQEGIAIPFGKFGHKSLLEFLKSIPDVLLVRGDTKFSEVLLIESEKSSHVNELVRRQKSSRKRGSFFSKNHKITRRQSVPTKNHKNPTNTSPKSPWKTQSYIEDNSRPDDGYSSQISAVNSNKNNKHTTHNETDSLQNNCKYNNVQNILPKQGADREATPNDNKFNSAQKKITSSRSSTEEMKSTLPRNSLNNTHSGDNQRLISEKTEIEKFPKNRGIEGFSSHKTVKDSSQLINRTKHKGKDRSSIAASSPTAKSFPDVDITLRVSKKQENTNYWRGGVIRKSMEKSGTFEYGSEAEYSSEINKSGWSTGSGDLMLSLLEKKSKMIEKKERCNENRIQRKVKNFIPKNVQSNLQKLISGFPEGIWCSELPVAYKKLMGKELCFENYGYRCLIYMCLDLEDIFHCVKESPYDYKLYDVKNPLPTYTEQEQSFEEPTTPEPPAVPDMIWGSFDAFLPEDVMKLGFKIERLQAADVLEVGMSVNVIVAEIYDISKFWIILDNSNLEYLMRDIQSFYETNYQRYLVPKSLLVEGLHCVVLYRDKFHRAVILNVMPEEDYLKVYYFDYGTLGKVSKSEVWFLTRAFSELPSQAIRSRLSDIYPPYKGVTWSPFANYEFSTLTCMKKLIAEIGRVDKNKNLADIKLRNSESYISDILVDLNYAIYINQPPKKHIEDPNCKSRVQFIHLFPTFDEIENWVVPSTEEASDFLNTSITADFLYSQYFSRTSYEDLIESIEEKMTIIAKKKKSLAKSVKPEDLLFLQSTDEMNKIAYGLLHVPKTKTEDEDIKKTCIDDEHDDSMSKRIIDIDNDEVLIGILRQTRMKKSLSLEKNQDISESTLDKSSNNSSFRSTGMVKEEHNSSFSNFMKNHSSLHEKVLKEFSNLSELEKYLSEDSSSKKSSSNLIDLDVELGSPVVSSTNLFMDSEFQTPERSMVEDQRCLLTEAIHNDFDQSTMNPLDFPIPDIPLPDLIQFDEEVSCFEVTSTSYPEEGPQSTKLIFDIGGSDCGDADDEDSDDKPNSIESSEFCHSEVVTVKESRTRNNNHDYDDSVSIEQNRPDILAIRSSSNISEETIKIRYENTSETDHSDQNDVGKNDLALITPNYAVNTSNKPNLTSGNENVRNSEVSYKQQDSQNLHARSMIPNGISDIETTSTANIARFCQPKHSTNHDLSDMTTDFNNLNINNDKLNTSTPLSNQVTYNEYKDNTDQFDVLDHSQTSVSTLYSNNEAAMSKPSVGPGEWMIQESQNSHCETDYGGSNYCQIAEQEGENYSTFHQTSNIAPQLETYESDMEMSSNSTFEFVHNNTIHSLTSNVQTPMFQGHQGMVQPRTMMVRPPPGFLPIVHYGHPNSLHPFGNHYPYVNPFNVPTIPGHILSLQQQEFINGIARTHNNPPIVIFNYNFLPHPNSMSTTHEK